eukprot:gnl/MRDRNA2_/MRDRNA2_96160_c0_seq1.p1 gnl/MRDRNA2_/MRDRNA2_96160_c0~~gnl/MRDRNA2_/MRDRNA2_96160_c0_seq1.p1  ORF type:complete len:644 (-),score=91.92 gnl/MRDRNA2_/MRDRNA2_96160_c0_seq1:171-2102(-)
MAPYSHQEALSESTSHSIAGGHDVEAVLNYTSARYGVEGPPVPTDVTMRDARPALETNQLDLFKNGFTLARQRTRVSNEDFYRMNEDKRVQRRYYREMEEMIKSKTGAHRVVIMNHLVRNAKDADRRGKSNPFQGGGNGINGYAQIVHSDYCAKKSVEKVYENENVSEQLQGKYMLINAWRNISEQHPIYNNTLACCDALSVNVADFRRINVPLGENKSTAEQYRLIDTSVPRHQWYYFPMMHKDEVLLFTQYDSNPKAPARFCFHTSFTDPSVPASAPPRESVEIRAIAFFPMMKTTIPYVLNAVAGLQDPLAMFKPDDAGHLIKALAQGASHGHLDLREIDGIVDFAALSGTSNDAVIMELCEHRNICYSPHEWVPGPKAQQMLRGLGRVREAFQPSPPLIINGMFDAATCKALQYMLVLSGYNDFGPIDGIFGSRTMKALRMFCQERGLSDDFWLEFANRWLRSMQDCTVIDKKIQMKLNEELRMLRDVAKLQPAGPSHKALERSPVPAGSLPSPPGSPALVTVEGTITQPGALGFEVIEKDVNSRLGIEVASITAGGLAAHAIPGLAVGMNLVTVNHELVEDMPYNEVFQMLFARPLHLGFAKPSFPSRNQAKVKVNATTKSSNGRNKLSQVGSLILAN